MNSSRRSEIRRPLGRTGVEVLPIGLGCWAIGGSWGTVSDDDSRATLHRAIDEGVNFFDTADVYGDGRSERLIGEVLRERKDEVFVATKAGRRLAPHVAEGYVLERLEEFVDRSLANLGVERLDLLQLHCPPSAVYEQAETFEALDRLTEKGKIRFYGVSVERVEEALVAIEQPNVQTVQIIFNALRQRPSTEFFRKAKEKRVGILARVPLASGLLTGKMRPNTTFAEDDHRNFNRHGAAFDVGETFAGVPYELALEVVEQLRSEVPEGATMAAWALRYVLDHDAVTVAIPGAKRPDQLTANLAALELPSLSEESRRRVERIYDEKIRPIVHERW